MVSSPTRYVPDLSQILRRWAWGWEVIHAHLSTAFALLQNTSDSKHYVLSREGFVKAVSDIMKHLSPSDAGAIYDKLAKEAGATGAVNYKVGLHV